MTFASFAKLESMGLPRPSLAPEGALHFTKLYPHILERRKGKLTTIRASKDCRYDIGQVVPIYLDQKTPAHKMFNARIVGIRKVKKIGISDNLAKFDADMTKEELWILIDFFYRKKYGGDPELVVISMDRI